MLYNQGDIITDVLAKLNQSTTAGFYTDDMLARWASNAHSWAAAKFKWPMTEGRYSTTSTSLGSNEDGWTTLEYPEGFRTDSIRLLTIGGKHFDKKNFYKFQQFLEDNSGDSSKIFTDYTRRVFINPSASGLSGTVTAWGQINVAPLLLDTVAGVSGPNGPAPEALTIFSGVEDDGNEAIVEKILSYALVRQKAPTSFYRGNFVSAATAHAQIAETLLAGVWKRIQEEQAMYQDTLNEGMWKRFDVLKGGFKEDIFKRDQWFS